MKKFALLIMFWILTICIVSSQDEVPINDVPLNYCAGGFGHFFIGPAVFIPGELENYLERPDVLNTSINTRSGVIIGGEGVALRGKILIGGGGYGLNIPAFGGVSSTVRFGIGTGYFKLGYMVRKLHPDLMFVYCNIGYGGLNVEIHNLSGESNIDFDNQNPVPARRTRNYGLTGFSLAPGISWKFSSGIIENEEVGGFMAGLDGGCIIFFPTGIWQYQNEVVTGPPIPTAIFTPYLRFTIGGGRFALR